MQKYKVLLFDLDGTLVYSHPGIYSCFRYALKSLQLPPPTEEQLKKCVGPSLMHSFMHYFGLDEETAEKATAKYREEYVKTGMYENIPIEGALEGLKTLHEKGYVLALATSKPMVFSEVITKRWGFSPYFTTQVGSGIDGSLPTKASVIAEAMRILGAKKEDCLMIGDREYDLEGARENGVDCALLKVGYAAKGEFERVKPDFVFDGFPDLLEFLVG